MENRYKVELWIDKLNEEIKQSSALKFNPNDNNIVHIVTNEIEDLFSRLVNDKALRFVNLDFENDDYRKAIEVYQNNNLSSSSLNVFSSLNKEEQNKRLKAFVNSSKKVMSEYSVNNLFVTFGLLDYIDDDEKHTIRSAPLVLIPVYLVYNNEHNYYQIKQINNEIYLNELIISKIRKSKKVDISYPIDSNFSLNEYLSYVAIKVHMFHYSVNNGVFLAQFDIYKQKYVEELIENQEHISNNPLIKSVSYYNSEFFNFTKNNLINLDRKLLTLLPIDNEEFRILKRIGKRESLLLRTNSIINKSHLFNNIISYFMLNNKHVLVVYDDENIKNEIKEKLDDSLLPYILELNEVTTKKKPLLNGLTEYYGNTFKNDVIDYSLLQEQLNRYYDVKNDFKAILNNLRIKREPFDLSINACIENYYRLNVPLIDITIPKIENITTEELENDTLTIRNFSRNLAKLNCYYKDHPFYGFSKNVMMSEEYLILKDAAFNLYNSIRKLRKYLNRLSAKYSFPSVNDLKSLKALLNIFSLADKYREYNQYFFKVQDFNLIEKSLKLVIEKNNVLIEKKKAFENKYSSKVYDIIEGIKNRLENTKNLSKKEIKYYKSYISTSEDINLSYLNDLCIFYQDIVSLEKEVKELNDNIDPNLLELKTDDGFDFDKLHEIETNIEKYQNSINYLAKQNIHFTLYDMTPFKDDYKYSHINVLKYHIQVTFNNVLKYSEIIQQYFDVNLFDFSTYSFELYQNKMFEITKRFISINDYLDFYVSLYKVNKIIPSLGNELLEERNYNLYDSMFYKRFYYDLSNHLMRSSSKKEFSNENVYKILENFDESENERKKLFDNVLKTNFYSYLRNNMSSLKRYEFNYIEEEKRKDILKPLSKITHLANESIYHIFYTLFTPLTSLSSLLQNDIYKFDCVIVLSNRNMLTKDMLAALNRSDQLLVFDNVLLKNNFENDYIDDKNGENFISAVKSCFETINYTSSTYEILPLRPNNKNIFFKRYLLQFLLNSGFKVASNVDFKDGIIDFLVKVEDKKNVTALIIDRLPYSSIESASDTFKEEDKLLKGSYSYIRIFPFAFFNNELEEKKKLLNKILDNASINVSKEVKFVKKKLTDVLFTPYPLPKHVYYMNKAKYVFNRQELFYKIIKECAPIYEKDILALFPKDGLSYIETLSKEKKIYIKDNFVYIVNAPISFRCYKDKNSYRIVEKISKEEIEDGVYSIVKFSKSISLDNVIKMILLSLSYKTMNKNNYNYIYHIIINMVENNKIILHEGVLYLEFEEKKIEEKDKEELMITRDDN